MSDAELAEIRAALECQWCGGVGHYTDHGRHLECNHTGSSPAGTARRLLAEVERLRAENAALIEEINFEMLPDWVKEDRRDAAKEAERLAADRGKHGLQSSEARPGQP